MRALIRSIGFVVAGVLLTAAIGSVRQPRSYSMLVSATSRDERCRERLKDLVNATMRGDLGARAQMLRDMPAECATRLRIDSMGAPSSTSRPT